MFNSVKLIEEVRKRGCLWKAREKGVDTTSERKRAWYQIAATMRNEEEWKKYNAAQKYDTVLLMQKKWKHLRDYYVRIKKSTNRLSKNRLKNNPLLKMLTFIDGPIITGITSKSEDISDDGSHVSEPDPEESVACPSPSAEPEPEPMMEEFVYYNDAETTSRSATIPPASDDPDRCFLLSLLPYMTSMSEDQNFQFRMQVMDIVGKIRFGISDPFLYCVDRKG